MAAVRSQRVIVLFDGQNFYRNARRAFFYEATVPGRAGQFWPRAVAELIVARYDDRELRDVRAYFGRPDRTRDPFGHAANVRQSVAWSKSGVQVRPRMHEPRDLAASMLAAAHELRDAPASAIEVWMRRTDHHEVSAALRELMEEAIGEPLFEE